MNQRVLSSLFILLACAFASAQQPRHDLTIALSLEFKTGPNAIPPNRTYSTVLSDRTVYLFDVDPAALLDKAGAKVERYERDFESHQTALLSDYLASENAMAQGGGSYLYIYRQRVAPILKPHLVRSGRTNSDGKLTFSAVPEGTYYVVAAAGNQYPHIWNQRVEVQASSTVVLDQQNRWRGPE